MVDFYRSPFYNNPFVYVSQLRLLSFHNQPVIEHLPRASCLLLSGGGFQEGGGVVSFVLGCIKSRSLISAMKVVLIHNTGEHATEHSSFHRSYYATLLSRFFQ
jgi:hypothetical protein